MVYGYCRAYRARITKEFCQEYRKGQSSFQNPDVRKNNSQCRGCKGLEVLAARATPTRMQRRTTLVSRDVNKLTTRLTLEGSHQFNGGVARAASTGQHRR